MDTRRILTELRAERSRIDQAIAAIEGLSKTSARANRSSAAPGPVRRQRRHMSAAARKRISEMMKARWAERKKKKTA
jgi:hypothetical protein